MSMSDWKFTSVPAGAFRTACILAPVSLIGGSAAIFNLSEVKPADSASQRDAAGSVPQQARATL